MTANAVLCRSTVLAQEWMSRWRQKLSLPIWLLLFFPASVYAQYGSWQTLASMPTARQGAAGGVIGGVFYIASGCCASNTPPVPSVVS